jgi:hypothetical protein
MTAVYFLKAIEAGWIKIGYSKRPIDRVADCQHVLSARAQAPQGESVTSSMHGTDGSPPPIPSMRSACSKGHQRENCAVTACERWRIVPAGMTPARGRSYRGASGGTERRSAC